MDDRDRADFEIRHYDKLKADRANFESRWQDIADYMRPGRSEFTVMRSPGARRDQKVFDSTAIFAVENFAGGLFGMMTNPANRWFALKVEDAELNDYDPVRDWLYECENRLLYSFGPQVSRFYAVAPALYADLACFGTGVFYSEEVEGLGQINDNVRSLAECVISENALGVVDTVYRKFAMSGRQALQQFGEQNLSRAAVKMATDKPFDMQWFLHCVKPNHDYGGASDKLAPSRFAFSSMYIEIATRHIPHEGGYYDCPYHIPRWAVSAGEMYGRGLGDQSLADVKMLNRMDETAIKTAQKIADPPLAAPDEGVIKQARTWPGGITYGAIDMEGRRLLQPLLTGANINVTIEMMNQRREAIKEAFFFSLMQMAQRGEMTATEWMGRQEEKLRLLGPNLGRLQNDLLSPLIKRRFGILQRNLALPPPPPEIQGARMSIEYVSPLARAQRSGEANSVIRTYQGVLPIAEYDPSVFDNFDQDAAARAIGEGFSIPAPVLRGQEEVMAIRAQRQQQQQMQQVAQMGSVAADASNKLASAAKSGAQAKQIAKDSGTQGTPPAVAGIIDQLRAALRGGRAA